MTQVSTLSQQLCDPRVNHFEAVYRIYHCMRKNINFNPGRVEFYPTYQEIDDILFGDQYKVMD